jgi:type I restriction enzyme S subunit
MKLETFFQRFDQFADAPDAVAKMRELVLQLALNGTVIGLDSDRWERVSLGSLGKWGSGGTPLRSEPQYYGGSIPWLVIGDLNDGIVTSASTFITEDGLANSSARMLPKGVLLIAMYGSIGKLGITGIECATNQAIAFCKPDPKRADLRYLFHALKGIQPTLLARGQGLAQKNISQTILRAWEINLPSLAEQKRIVAKVDELMALCDRLEAQQQERETRHAALARASLARFADAPTPANLTFIFHSSYAISPGDLRKSILTLAVQGKLVPQDPNDELAEVTFPGLKPTSPDSSDGSEPPDQWALCTYRSLTTLVTSGSRGWKEFYASKGSIFVRTQNIKTDKLVLDDVAFVDLPKSAEGMRAQVLKDDILITITGANVTKAARVEEQIPEAYVSQHIALTRPRWPEMSEWLHLCFISHGSARGALEQLAYGDKPGLNLNNIRDLVFPIPPLAEQRRIVAKVEQLVALVDELETQLATARTTGADLMEAVVAELTARA